MKALIYDEKTARIRLRQRNIESDHNKNITNLCGVSPEDYTPEKHIPTPRNQRENKERELEEFYRNQDKTHNTAHLYLTMQERTVPGHHLIETSSDTPLLKTYMGIMNQEYNPLINQIIKNTSLEKMVSKAREEYPGHTELVESMWGNWPSRIANNYFANKLEESYYKSELDFEKIVESSSEEIIKRAKMKGQIISPEEIGEMEKIVGSLSGRERKVVGGRIDGKRFSDLAEEMRFSLENIRLIYEKSSELLANPSQTRALRYSTGRILDYNETKKHIKENPLSPDELRIYDAELDRRTLNALITRDIYILGEVRNIKEGDLLKTRNFGKESLYRLNEELNKYGIEIGENLSPSRKVVSGGVTSIEDTPIESMEEFSTRAIRCLSREFKTMGELGNTREEDLLRIRNFGRKTLEEVKEILASHGLKLND